MQHASFRRDIAAAAGILWLSGLISLALLRPYQWIGWLQMAAAVVLFMWYRASRLRIG